MKQSKVMRFVRTALVCMAVAGGAERVSAYEFILSGYPAENPRSSLESGGAPVVTSTLSKGTAAQPLEARFRSWLSGLANKINTFPPTGFMLFFR